MDWLKDKKNQPIVAAALAVIVIGAGAAVYFTMFAGGGGGVSTTDATAPGASGTAPPMDTGAPAATTADMGAGYPPGGAMPGAPGAPGATSAPGAAVAAPAPTPPGGAVPMEVWRADPFQPAGYKPPKKQTGPKPKPPIKDLPFNNFSQWVPPERKAPPPDLVQPVRRMAGIIVSDRIYAIIETNGVSQVVQPGDMLDDRLAKVERIERDKVILKTMDKVPKYITVPMTSSPRPASTVTTPTTPSGGPMPPPMPMMPGGRTRGRYGGAGAGEPMAPM